MKNRLFRAFFSSSIAILPIIILIAIMSLTGIARFPHALNYVTLIIGAICLISGLALFQIGADIGLTKVGEYMGSSLSKQKSIFVVIIFAFALGALITCAEPSILIIAADVSIPSWLLLGGISVGVGLFVVIGILRIVFHGNLKVWYLFLYAITFMLICLIEEGTYLPFIFDSGGITTGSATVPFILALGAGVAFVRSGKNAYKDSFGLVGMASIGPILTMTIIILINQFTGSSEWPYEVVAPSMESKNILLDLINQMIPTSSGTGTLLEVLIAMLPIIIIFLIYNFIFIKLPKAKIFKLLVGFLYSYIGLVIFLSGVGAAMTPIGKFVGQQLAVNFADNKGIIILIAFIIGMVTILCEPAVHVLTTQIENISDGSIKKTTVLLTLSIGVGIAIALAITRSLYNFSILYYIIPLFVLTITLMFITPDLFVAIAFDSGGTASGPLAVSFVLPRVIGMTYEFNNNANIYEQAFGVVALIATTPLVCIQLLGLKTKVDQFIALRSMAANAASFDDAQIIHF